MKKYTLASLALFLAPAALAEPGVEETLAYINGRCDGFARTHSGIITATTRSVSLQGSQLVYKSESQDVVQGTQNLRTYTGRLDLRRVEISYYVQDDTPPSTRLRCGDKCITEQTKFDTIYSNGETRTETREDKQSAAYFYCRDADRVTRAFERLQTLVGGAIKDPFAN